MKEQKSHLFIVPEEKCKEGKDKDGWFSSKSVPGQWAYPLLSLEMLQFEILEAFNILLIIL